ncbi:AzlD domain-containing protein [Actinorugispora endophytica]|uniref:Branched-subunit amino acid transport protein AzlD n=1 Tax=Actinorugispora endophytica TaxID=1605990 RepID=A0A4R6US65_9ACTN|nr:AzlD domain-containing protein [Actinorugispora endophytica]TDQ48483.1 branched-subunit amino acid transport protein AzlD [Actinorugispora endophytica]
MTLWITVLATGVGCYLLKYAGLAAPRRLLDHPLVSRFALIVPVALLAALIALQTVADGDRLVLDLPRLGGLVAAVVALLLRAPFLLVIVAAAGTAAGLRALGVG